MIDFVTILFVVIAAVGYTWIVKNKSKNAPNTTEGPSDHKSMPEVDYVFPLEASELNASTYSGAGSRYQVGAFGLKTI